MKNYVIKNSKLEVEISTFGAEIQSLKFNGKQKFWTGDEAFWSGKSPVLFPICGRLKDGVYYYNGVAYKMPPHGFAKKSEFTVTSAKEDEITFLLKWNEETLEVYPFKFEFFITYRIEDSTLFVKAEAVNCGEGEMYCSFGSHESYLLEGNIEDYCLKFEKKENFHSNIVTPAVIICRDFDNFGDNTDLLPLGYYLIKNDTAVFPNLKSRKFELMKNGETIATVNFDASNMLIWTKPNAPFVCIEPWFNLPDYDDTNCLLTEKPGMVKVEAGKSFISEHKITYHK